MHLLLRSRLTYTYPFVFTKIIPRVIWYVIKYLCSFIRSSVSCTVKMEKKFLKSIKCSCSYFYSKYTNLIKNVSIYLTFFLPLYSLYIVTYVFVQRLHSLKLVENLSSIIFPLVIFVSYLQWCQIFLVWGGT